jgi:hypothetical protein
MGRFNSVWPAVVVDVILSAEHGDMGFGEMAQNSENDGAKQADEPDGDGEWTLTWVAIAVSVEEGPEDQQHEGDRASHDAEERAVWAFKVFEQLITRQEVPLGLDVLGGDEWVGRLADFPGGENR